MALQTRISNAAAIAACNAIVDLIDADAAAGYVEIRDGTQPADPDTAATGTLLATVTLDGTNAFGTATDAAPGGQASATGLPKSDVSIDAPGTASWFRVYDGASLAVMDGSVDVTGNTPDMVVNTTTFTAGATFEITAWTVTMPES